jgi:hypothetical protein
MRSSMRDWLRLPSQIALLLGLGALSIAGAKADTGEESLPARDDARVPQQSARTFDDLLIWSDAGRIYTAETGKPAEELRLGDTVEAELLRRLLEREGANAATPRVLHDRIILVGAGGAGLHWESHPPAYPDRTQNPTPRDSNKPASGIVKPAEQPGTTQASDDKK